MSTEVVEGVVLPRRDLEPAPDPRPAWDPEAWRRPHPAAQAAPARGLLAEFWSHPFLRATTWTGAVGTCLAFTIPDWVWVVGLLQAVAVVREVQRWPDWRIVYRRRRAVWIDVTPDP